MRLANRCKGMGRAVVRGKAGASPSLRSIACASSYPKCNTASITTNPAPTILANFMDVGKMIASDADIAAPDMGHFYAR